MERAALEMKSRLQHWIHLPLRVDFVFLCEVLWKSPSNFSGKMFHRNGFVMVYLNELWKIVVIYGR